MGSPTASRLGLLLAAAPASGHLHPASLIIAAIVAAVVYVLVVVIKPTKRCGLCRGERVVFTTHWLTGKSRVIPCRRCSGTGRTPWPLARSIHRNIWAVRKERDKP
jgi:hypothetical protein